VTPNVGEIWKTKISGQHYLLLDRRANAFSDPAGALFLCLHLEKSVVELWVVSKEHYRRVA
jgi:hypothetical protein